MAVVDWLAVGHEFMLLIFLSVLMSLDSMSFMSLEVLYEIPLESVLFKWDWIIPQE